MIAAQDTSSAARTVQIFSPQTNAEMQISSFLNYLPFPDSWRIEKSENPGLLFDDVPGNGYLLPAGHYFPTYSGDRNKLMIRKSYVELADKIINKIKNKGQILYLLGTTGIGKSLFLCYLANVLLQRLNEFSIEWNRCVKKPLTYDDKRTYLCGKTGASNTDNVICIYDDCVPEIIGSKYHIICYSGDIERFDLRQTGFTPSAKYYMPLWTIEECQEYCRLFGRTELLKELPRRFQICGGLPRWALQETNEAPSKVTIDMAAECVNDLKSLSPLLESLQENIKPNTQSVGRYLVFDADASYTVRTEYKTASTFQYYCMFLMKLKHQANHMNSMLSGFLNKNIFFDINKAWEVCSIWLLYYGCPSKCFKMIKGGHIDKREEVYFSFSREENFNVENIQFFSDIEDAAKLANEFYSEPNRSPRAVFAPPGFALFDGLIFPEKVTDDELQPIYLLQTYRWYLDEASVNEFGKHSFSAEGATACCEAFDIKKYKFYYFVITPRGPKKLVFPTISKNFEYLAHFTLFHLKLDPTNFNPDVSQILENEKLLKKPKLTLLKDCIEECDISTRTRSKCKNAEKIQYNN